MTSKNCNDGELFWPLVLTKMFAMAFMGTTAFVAGIVPLKLAKYFQNDITVSGNVATTHSAANQSGHAHHNEPVTHFHRTVPLIMCTGGSFLLFTAMLHILPEVREDIKHMQDHKVILMDTDELADKIAWAGFILMMFINQAAHAFVAWNTARQQRAVSTNVRLTSISMISIVNSDIPMESNGYSYQTTADSKESVGEVPSGDLAQYSDGQGASELECKVNIYQFNNSGLLTVLALSVHETFEGISVGLEKCQNDIWTLCVAIAMHKLIIAFSIGLDMVYSNSRRSLVFLNMFTFAVATPVGIAIGMIFFRHGTNDNFNGPPSPWAVTLQGLAVGTILYVVFFEIFYKYAKPGFAHVSAILFGFILHILFHRHHIDQQHDAHQHIHYQDHHHHHEFN